MQYKVTSFTNARRTSLRVVLTLPERKHVIVVKMYPREGGTTTAWYFGGVKLFHLDDFEPTFRRWTTDERVVPNLVWATEENIEEMALRHARTIISIAFDSLATPALDV